VPNIVPLPPPPCTLKFAVVSSIVSFEPPNTCNLAVGPVVPTPTLPELLLYILLPFLSQSPVDNVPESTQSIPVEVVSNFLLLLPEKLQIS
jgi:hypothetical protein